MSDLSFLEKLLDGAKVEWKPLGDVAKVLRGASPRPISKFITDDPDGVPWIKIGDTELGSKYVTKTAQKITADGAEKSRRLSKGDFIISNSMSFGRPYILALDGAIHDGWASVSDYQDALNSDFLYHYLSSHAVQSYWLTKINSGSVSNLNSKLIQALEVPIPCPENPEKSLAIQGEIVRVLDSFTELTAELTAELELRKKQYNHYRDQLLTFEDGDFGWKSLGDLSLRSYSGATPKAGNPKYYEGGTIPWLRTQEVVFSDIYATAVKITQEAVDETAAKWIPANCVIVAISGATAGRSGINKIPLTTNQHCCCLEIDAEQALYRYVFHWVSMKYEKLKERGQGARGDLNSGIIKGFGIPIPFPDDPERSLAEQARIAEILDTFDTLTTSLSEGLPREIELRKKQYEYYRDLLLSFPKSAEAVEG